MTGNVTLAKVEYFGKIPSRGDFIKAADNLSLIQLLDNWLAQTMELLTADPRWKLVYDAVQPLHFAFIGPRSKRAIAGHLVASNDEAQRRFPFLTMSVLEAEQPYAFVLSSPIILSRLWSKLGNLTGKVMASEDPAVPLQTLSSSAIELDLANAAYEAVFTDFLEFQTLASFEALLAQGGFRGNVRHIFLALGFLLQPVMASSTSRLEKSLVLPLPNDPMYRYLVATFWMHLITPFLRRADFELAIFITQMHDKPSLVIGFSGASSRTLHAIIDPQIASDQHIAFENSEWVEDQLNSDFGVRKLSSYLLQPQLSLASAHDAFVEVFTGA